jgi:outer membrane protein assembly factor BamD
VVKQYQDSPAVEEALAIMMVGYRQLGLADLSNDAKRVLTSSFPESIYLKRGYDPTIRGGAPKPKTSFWSKIF